jgi:succinate dehydrogenase flavin-adding protein (antitoxin of CptAB toxin-antitoxin module)
VDLLLGSWAESNVMQLTREEMDDYESILNCETVDIFNYVSAAIIKRSVRSRWTYFEVSAM